VSNSIILGGQADIVLNATSTADTIGTALSTTDPSTFPIGALTAHVDTASDVLYVSPSPNSGFPFCGPHAAPTCN
jgi:hypothetical protein